MKRTGLAILGWAVAVTVLWAGDASAQDSYFEDFSTQDYMAGGTALWDTTSGVLTIDPFVPALLGAYDTAGDARGVAVSGDLVCVADGANGLLVFDVTDPTAPALKGEYNTSGNALRVVIDGNLAFVADSAGGLVVIDISDPTVPALVDSYPTAGVAGGVAVAGDYAYVADGLAGLAVIDISNPAALALAGTYNTVGYANDVVVSNEVAYVADGTEGLAAIRIAQPAAPALLGSYDTAGYATNLAVSGTLVYVADGNNGVVAIDVTDPATPLLAGSFGTYSANDVAVAGDIVCAAAGSTGLVVVDFTDPAAPMLIGSYDSSGYGWGVAVDGEVAYLGDSGLGLAAVQVQVPVPPAFRDFAFTTPAVDIAVAGDWAVAATISPSALVFLDVSTPNNIVERGSYPLSDPPQGLAMDGSRVVVAGGWAGVRWIDAADPNGLVSYDTPGFTVDVAVSGGLVYAADSEGGLSVYDMTNFTPVGQYDSADDIVGVAIAGNIAYASVGLAGVVALDITNPAVPVLLGTCDTPGSAGRLVVAGDHAYVADGFSGLSVLDISDPVAMGVATTLAVGNVVDVDISGNRVFCLLSGSGVTVVDVTDPGAPSESTSFTIGGMSALAVAGEHLYVAYESANNAVRSYRVAQHETALALAYGQSLRLPFPYETVRKIRLTTTQTGSVSWRVSTDYSYWTDVPSLSSWVSIPNWDRNVRWRAELSWTATAPPLVENVLVEILHSHADIMSVSDVGNDQGRQVSLDWCRSAYDFTGETSQIVEYAVYRRIDGAAKAILAIPEADFSELGPAARDHAEKMQAAGWHFLVTVPVRTEDRYAVVVPTLADSTISAGQHFSTFMVSALTAMPGQFYDSPPDSGYSVDNLAPGVPTAVVAAYSADAVVLDWADTPESDFQYYRVYRSTDPGFIPSPDNLVQEIATSAWTDPATDPWGYHYRITALDHAGNESEPGSPASVSGTRGAVPVRTALREAVPNPFNPSTKLFFELSAAGHVRLEVYDLAGRQVAVLVDEHRESGRHHATWEGRDQSGRQLASGVYFYRLTTGSFSETKRMVLVK